MSFLSTKHHLPHSPCGRVQRESPRNSGFKDVPGIADNAARSGHMLKELGFKVLILREASPVGR